LGALDLGAGYAGRINRSGTTAPSGSKYLTYSGYGYGVLSVRMIVHSPIRLLSVGVGIVYLTAGVYAFVDPRFKTQIAHQATLWLCFPLLLSIAVTILSVRRPKGQRHPSP
jgi:hypothetical protein